MVRPTASRVDVVHNSGERDDVRNAEIVREAIDAVWNRGELERIPEFYVEDFRLHPSGPWFWDWPPGLDGIRQIVTTVRTAFPDYHESLDILVQENDLVCLYQTVTGTNTGPGAFQPTFKSFTMDEAIIYKVVDGKLTEQRGVFNKYSFLVDLGLIVPISAFQR
jgi:predicted ester cyclase